MLFSFLLASLPIAPFTAPEQIVIPSGFPSGTLPPQIFRKADWLSYPGSIKENFRGDSYVGLSRRRGNIVSLYVLRRRLCRNWINKNMPPYRCIPSHTIYISRFDCVNDRYQSDFSIVSITRGIDDKGEVKRGFLETDPSDGTILGVSPGQVRVTIEGYPYWAMSTNYKQTLEWIPIRIGSNGAFQLDYACKNY